MRLIGIVAVLVALGAGTAEAATKKAAKLQTLSNRADLISGGDALVQLTGPAGTRVDVDGRDVTGEFAVRPDGRVLALLRDLELGDNVVTATTPGGVKSSLTIVNHPLGGPVLAGPQIQPWTCFEGALDDQCNREPVVTFQYKSTQGGGLQAYDPENPPSDVATTTTDQDKEVPFIVRYEVGAIDRDEYRIAILYDPSKPFEPYAPQDGFNHKLVITHGASCDTAYEQADAPDVLLEDQLAKGFAVMSHALDNAGHNCNIATQAEALIMTKEYLIDHFGTVRYTIGSGCSGGSLTQQQVANAYPGVYQGITPACSFTDAWSSAMQYVDYQLLRRYYEDPSRWAPGVAWDPNAIAAVEGHISPANAVTFTAVIPSSGDPSRSCPGVPAEDVYDENTNPKGVRCSFQDYMVNVFGVREKDGFAQRPYDNVGIEYGRDALAAGKLTAAQFVDVNAKLGSWDIDYNETAERAAADRPGLERVYKSGAVNQGSELDKVAIIDLRGPDPGAFHDVYRTYTMRARLMREHGTAANQVLWRGLVPLMGDAGYTTEAIFAVDEWLANVEKDTRDVPLARKILDDKPEGLTDRCTNGAGVEQPASVCDGAVTAYTDPRQEAGMPEADDTMKCDLKPLDRGSYGVEFTDEQWAAMEKAFPEGVCDYAKPGVDRVPVTTWQTYQDKTGAVVYGGRALGAPPVSRRAVKLRIARGCVRDGRVRVRLRGPKLKSARVIVGGKRVARLGRKRRTVLRVSAPVRVKVVGRTLAGKRVVAKRRFRRCG